MAKKLKKDASPDLFRTPVEEAVVEKEVFDDIDKLKKYVIDNVESIKSGAWFYDLLRQVVESYDRNATAAYFQKKYPGLPADDLAEILSSVASRYAAVAGAVSGAAISATQVGAAFSAGLTAGMMLFTIGAGMFYMTRIQMRLILDLSVVYGIELNPNDPEDMLTIFSYALGIAPTELIGKGVQTATAALTTGLIKDTVSKETLKAIQSFGQQLGFHILQRTIIQYAVPVVSATVGSTYNYMTTRSVSTVAKTYFRNRGKVVNQLSGLVSQQRTYDLVFPAAAMYIAQVDGKFSPQEREFYKSMLKTMEVDEHQREDFERLLRSENKLLEAMKEITSEDDRRNLLDVLVLMAVYDGELAEAERNFLAHVAEQLNVTIDFDAVEKRAGEFRQAVRVNILQQAAGTARNAASGVASFAQRAAHGIQNAAADTSNRLKDAVDGLNKSDSADSGIICAACSTPIPSNAKFCPECGAAIATA
jgi:tellurite resistance protein